MGLSPLFLSEAGAARRFRGAYLFGSTLDCTIESAAQLKITEGQEEATD